MRTKLRTFRPYLIIAVLISMMGLILVVPRPVMNAAWSLNIQEGRPTRTPTARSTPRPAIHRNTRPVEFKPTPGEETFWLKVDDSDVEQLELYLKTFPNGYYKGLANLKLIKLRKLSNTPILNPINFDSYPDIFLDDEKARLDNFAIALQNEPGAQGYYMIFGSCEGEADRRAARAVDYLVNSRGIDRGRIVVVDAGCRETLLIELWLQPTGASAPIPTNNATVSPCPKCRAARRRGEE